MAVDYKRLYGTKQWFRLRHHQLQKEPLCRFCLEQKRVSAATLVDHIEPHRGVEEKFYDPANLQSLCKPCHDSIKQQMEKSGVMRGCDESGLPLDRNHHWNRK
ncbi:HNH endonuclease [Herbaspirillum rubrisubalbicans Os34]|uniref:Putative HNH nuclease YajD n=2 Tax=Herbaspirillum rubrisubalbicans TaxID=80842 RepID=A0A6M3ZZA8_9BURK|nr:HNH endonuclease [Herbaspirillum rubrisubalbicans Os34]